MHYALILLLFAGSFGDIKTTSPEPQLIFRFLVDNAVVEMSKGAPATGKSLSVSYKLDENSEQLFPELKRQPIKVKCQVSIERGPRRLATVSSPATSQIPLIQGMTPGDRLLIEIQEMSIRQKDGTWLRINEKAKPIYTIPLY